MAQNTASKDELDRETLHFMYDYMTDIGGVDDRPVKECVKDLVESMRTEHDREYSASTQTLVEAGYDLAKQAIAQKKRENSGEIAAEIERE